jgi:hypothetical protein
MSLIREELVEASVMRCITTGLPGYGYTLGEMPPANVYVREAFPTPEERGVELAVTTLAFGFNIDDGGLPAEMGSNLTKYVHTLTCWVFALEPRFGLRLAHTIKHVVRGSLDQIPLLDFNQPDAPQIDALNVLKTQVRHEVNNSPRPWDQYVWTASISVRDVCYPSTPTD